ncbi:hypothetical protein LU276_09540 [Moraxella haemolytica]|uniref:hypothetical protein n=1 Tax=Moraxella haemolytica TaxID=2904119 RepID=UPI0025430B1C|nr:hypothetical protein [Moraxella sp. ZY171148]WII95220.1 hypothetical protein LU276_09540 [Moraxella sp. ZY171148]
MSKSIIKNDIAKIKSEIQKWHDELKQLNQEKSSYEMQIKELEMMPVNRTDFGVLLKESIAQEANNYTKNIAQSLLQPEFSDKEMQEKHNGFKAMNERSLKDFEWCKNNQRFEWLFNSFRSHQNLMTPSNSTETRQMLCWLMPDVVYEKTMHIINTEIGDEWGNDDLPSISERYKLILSLKEKISSCQNRIDELQGVIDEMSSITIKPEI